MAKSFSCNPMKMLKWIFTSVLRIALLFLVIAQIVSCCVIDHVMFHPVKGGYDATLDGYVDIGTNGVAIAAVVRGPEKGRKAIIYCHGNAEDITSSLDVLDVFADDGYTVATVDYPGYGLSAGAPDEDGCYRNVHRLYDWLIEKRGFAPEEIVVIGFSIGTGSAVELAAEKKVSSLILEAPFLSAPRVVTKIRILFIDPFPNFKRIAGIDCPLLVIHGNRDTVIPFSHGKELFALAKEPKNFIEVEGADHCNFIGKLGFNRYHSLVTDFIENHRVEATSLP